MQITVANRTHENISTEIVKTQKIPVTNRLHASPRLTFKNYESISHQAKRTPNNRTSLNHFVFTTPDVFTNFLVTLSGEKNNRKQEL